MISNLLVVRLNLIERADTTNKKLCGIIIVAIIMSDSQAMHVGYARWVHTILGEVSSVLF
jgi:hypothetical protein